MLLTAMKWCNSLNSLNLKKFVIAIAILNLFGCQNSRYITPPTQSVNTSLNSAFAEGTPSFSYDGRYLIFESDRDRERSLFLYDLQRRRMLPIPGLNQPGSMQYQADLSSDARYIVYVSEQLGKTDIFLYDRSDSTSQNLTKNFIGEVRNPSISGNGRFISFEGNRLGRWNIEVYDRGGGIDFSSPRSVFDSSSLENP